MEDDELHSIRCQIQRSARYHRARERFFTTWSNIFSFFCMLSGSAVVVSMLSSAPAWLSITAGAVVAIAQALELIGRVSQKAMLHNGLATEFISLERSMHTNDDVNVKALRSQILSIEVREPPIKRFLDLICHNQVALAIGSEDIVKLTFWQRHLAQYRNCDTALQNQLN